MAAFTASDPDDREAFDEWIARQRGNRGCRALRRDRARRVRRHGRDVHGRRRPGGELLDRPPRLGARCRHGGAAAARRPRAGAAPVRPGRGAQPRARSRCCARSDSPRSRGSFPTRQASTARSRRSSSRSSPRWTAAEPRAAIAIGGGCRSGGSEGESAGSCPGAVRGPSMREVARRSPKFGGTGDEARIRAGIRKWRRPPQRPRGFLASCARGELNPHALSGTGT